MAEPMDGFPADLSEAWEPQRILHEGEGSHLWVVRRPKDGQEAVLKLFSRVREAREQEEVLSQAKTVAGLDCPGLPAILGAGAVPEGAYVVTEKVEGQVPSDSRCPAGVLDVLRELEKTLRVLHHAGLCHGDVRSGNVRVTGEGRVKLLGCNYGTDPRNLDEEEVPTRTGFPQYMAPQLYFLKRAGAADDWFAWAVTGWYLCEGGFPFAQEHMDESARVQSLPRLKPSSLDPDSPLAEAILGCLAYTPQDRSATIARLPELLGEAEDPGRPTVFEEVERRPLPERPRKKPSPPTSGGRPPADRPARAAKGSWGLLIGLGVLTMLAVLLSR